MNRWDVTVTLNLHSNTYEVRCTECGFVGHRWDKARANEMADAHDTVEQHSEMEAQRQRIAADVAAAVRRGDIHPRFIPSPFDCCPGERGDRP